VKLRGLVEKVFFLLNKEIKRGERVYSITVEDILIDEDWKLHLPPVGLRDYHTKPDFGMLILRHRNELTKLPEWTAVLECISKDDIIEKHLKHQLRSPFGGTVLNEFNLLYWAILMAIDENKPLHFDVDFFNSAYEKVESYFYSKTLTRKSTCLLLGFDSEADEIDPEHGLRIRKITKDEILELWQTSGWFRALVEFSPEFSFKPLKYALELSIEASKIADDEKYQPEDADIKLEKVLSALRLFKKGWVDYPFIKETADPRLSSELTYSMKHSKLSIISPPFGETSYRLSKEEANEFKEFYKRIRNKIDCSSVSLKRFNDTYRRVNVEDKLIDYLIAFESLYLADESKLEMSYKLAHRVALLLCRNEAERKQTFLEMKKAYTLRSDIVHGDSRKHLHKESMKIGDKEYSLSAFVQRIEEHLRLSIRLFLEKPKQSWINLMFKDAP
jgi:hypothetical protein